MEYIQWEVKKEDKPSRHHLALRFNKSDISDRTNNFNEKMTQASAQYNFKYVQSEDGTSTAVIEDDNINDGLGKIVDLFRLSLVIINN